MQYVGQQQLLVLLFMVQSQQHQGSRVAPGHVAGLRYQVDGGGIDYGRFLGKPFEIHVELRDRRGATVHAVLQVKIASTLHAR